MKLDSEKHYFQEPTASYLPPKGQLTLIEWYRPTDSKGRIEPMSGNGKYVDVVFRDLVPYLPSTPYGTFGLYRYPAKFIPQVVAYVIERYGIRGQTILDPFAGCGTSGLTARLFGLNYELWDLNPLLEILHEIAIMKPSSVDSSAIVNEMANCTSEWLPHWRNLTY